VCDAAGQLAERLGLARLHQLLFEFALIRDVEQGSRIFDRLAGRVAKQYGLVEEVFVAAVGALPTILDRHRAALLPLGETGEHAFAIFGMETLGPQVRRAANVVQGETGQLLEVAADKPRHARVGVEFLEVEDDRQRLDDGCLAQLRLLQLTLVDQPLAFRVKCRLAQLLLGLRLSGDLLA
jgi:hypothetical protein